jgi:glycosyltransferase involved in cell wall biosynthesis
MGETIRVLQFADVVNRHDFIDTIVRRADPERFLVGLCVRVAESNIAAPVYTERTPRWRIAGPSRAAAPRAAVQLARILRDWRADILHTHHYDQAVIGLAATRLNPRTRLVVGRHYSDAIHRLASPFKKRALLGVEQSVNRAAARIVAPSTYIREILSGWQGVEPAKIDLIPYGFEAEKYSAPDAADVRRLRAEFGLDGRFVIGTFARLHEEKGHRFMASALKQVRERVPNVLWLVVGEGPERAALERQLGEDGLAEAARLVGWRRDAMTIMAAADAVVQPTLQEAFSQAMVEALWMRRALVITDVSGAPDIIEDGRNGLLVPRGDAAALASAVIRLARDADLRTRLGEAGRAHVEERLDIDKIIRLYEESYLRALGK